MARSNWYRLDNIGKLYSAQAGSSSETVFRCSATLADEIDPVMLQHALDKTAASFPSFNVCLRSGMFWHYLEQSGRQVAVTDDNLPVCFGLRTDPKSILLRVTWYRARINLEVSHVVADGRGALSFFESLVCKYAQERYGIDAVPSSYDGSDHQKSEDSFKKYFEKSKAGNPHASKVFRLPGWRDAADPTFMEYHVSTSRVLGLSHACGVSMTALITAALACAIRSEMPSRERSRQIRFDIPVDLRQFFESATLKNFFGLAYISYVPGITDEPLEEVARQMQEQIKAATQPDILKQRVNRMVALEKNPFLRLAPLFVKDLALDLGNRIQARKVTTTISNLGSISFPDGVAKYIRDINLLSTTKGLTLVICSFGDDLSIGISSIYANPDVIKNFCRTFSERGIEGRINSNRSYGMRLGEQARADRKAAGR